MRCLTYLLLLPETLKKSRKIGRLPLCYELLPLSLPSRRKPKMAAELCPAASTTSLSGGTTTVAAAEATKAVQVKQAAGRSGSAAGSPAAAAATTQQNINNNNVEPPSWQSSHPTLRERYPRPERLPSTCRLVQTPSIWGWGG